MIHAFLDESGTHVGAQVLAVAGFYGSGNQWRKFRNIWKPFSRGFHAKNSSSRFPRICDAIEKSKINGVVICLGNRAYKNQANPQVQSKVGNAYGAATLLCATDICDETKPRRVSFSIEQGQPNVDFVRSVLEGLRVEKHLAIAEVATVGKEDFIELHTADFASHIVSCYEAEWAQRLINSQRLAVKILPERAIAQASVEVKKWINQARAIRRALSRDRQQHNTH